MGVDVRAFGRMAQYVNPKQREVFYGNDRKVNALAGCGLTVVLTAMCVCVCALLERSYVYYCNNKIKRIMTSNTRVCVCVCARDVRKVCGF